MGKLRTATVNESLIALSGYCHDGTGNILKQKRRLIEPPFCFESFRDGPKDQTRNLEIPGSMLRIAPE
jgi:hypothetical protein